MSNAPVLVFVEGWSDRAFYSELCEKGLVGVGVPYDLRSAEELDGSSGGKEKLLALFNTLIEANALLETFQGRTTAFLFFLDKDVDDVLGKIVESDHIIYTVDYQLENHLFRSGDLVRAAMAATGLDRAAVTKALGDPQDWCARVATVWRDWVTLCLHCALHGVSANCSYRRTSQINKPPLASVDTKKRDARLAELQNASGLSPGDFEARRLAVDAIVEAHYGHGLQDGIFRGKWYPFLLAAAIRSSVGRRRYNRNGVEERVIAALTATLDVSRAWSEPFLQPITRLVTRLMAA